MQELTKLAIDDFLDQTADRSLTPGGGSVTGVAGALACALARMVSAYSLRPARSSSTRQADPDGPAQTETIAVQLHRVDQLLRALVTQDAVAYQEMTAAGKVAGDSPKAQAAYQEAVLAAVAVPLEMAALASNATAAMDELKSLANPSLTSDLAIAAVLAEATARAARYTALINLRELDDQVRRSHIRKEIDDIVAHCADHCQSIERFVCDRLEDRTSASR